jgi:hypothetical protein
VKTVVTQSLREGVADGHKVSKDRWGHMPIHR